MIIYILSIIIAILIVFIIIQQKKVSHVVEANIAVEKNNQALFQKNQQLSLQNQQEEQKLIGIKEQIQAQNNILQSVKSIKETQIQTLQQDLEQWKTEQEIKLNEEFDLKREKLTSELQMRSLTLLKQLEEKQSQLNDLQAKQFAYIQAQKRAEEIRAKQDYFRMVLSDLDLQDIKLLRNIQLSFSHKEAIDKLIWETYYKTPYDVLMSHIFEDNKKICGIYKITNLDNQQSYIGQSVDIRERWRQHIKSGLSFTPPANKLYQQMKEFGPERFTFEILENVSREKLNERESYWIEFYKTKDYGMNSQKGNS